MQTEVLDYNLSLSLSLSFLFFKEVKSIRMILSFWLERNQIQLDLMRMTLGFTVHDLRFTIYMWSQTTLSYCYSPTCIYLS